MGRRVIRESPLDRLAEAQIRVRDQRRPPVGGVADSHERDDARRHQRALDKVELAYLWTVVAGRMVCVVAGAAGIALAVMGRVSITDIPVPWK
jgi:hypothetical protein